MNPWNLSPSDLLVWGLVLHLIADWPLQNDWMATCKAVRRVRRLHKDLTVTPVQVYQPPDRWWDRHPAAYVHAGIHGGLLAIVFGWAAIPLAVVHLIIDTRRPVVWWSKLIRQTQPDGNFVRAFITNRDSMGMASLYDIGIEVRFWTDQVFHIVCIAIAAVLVSLG